MKSLIYISEPNQQFSREALIELAAKATTNNSALEITGFLRFQNGMFLQYLEGESINLGNLLAKLAMDTRHTIVNTLYNDHDHPRRFGDWGMKFVDEQFLEQHSVETFLSNQLQLMKEQELCDQQWQKLIWQGVEILSRCVKEKDKISD